MVAVREKVTAEEMRTEIRFQVSKAKHPDKVDWVYTLRQNSDLGLDHEALMQLFLLDISWLPIVAEILKYNSTDEDEEITMYAVVDYFNTHVEGLIMAALSDPNYFAGEAEGERTHINTIPELSLRIIYNFLCSL